MILKDVCFNNREKSILLLPPELKLLLYPSCHILPLHFLFACDLPSSFFGRGWDARARPSCARAARDRR